MARIYNINGTSALKASESSFKVIDCTGSGTHSSNHNTFKDKILFRDERLYDVSEINVHRGSQCKINPFVLGVISTLVTFALCLISTAL